MALQTLARPCKANLPSFLHPRHFHSSPLSLARAAPTASKKNLNLSEAFVDLHMLDNKFANDDTSSAGHMRLQEDRRLLYYMRLIEHDMAKLSAYRKPFIPPSKSLCLVVRSISYGGEEHPADQKRAIVVPVARLPLANDAAIHKFKVLAGTRWTIDPPRDSGISSTEGDGEHGYFKISCEDFPKGAMNLKWASDAIDRLIAKANESGRSWISSVPLDTRHIEARIRKAKRGDHAYGRGGRRPSIRDFPQEWLPKVVPEAANAPPVTP